MTDQTEVLPGVKPYPLPIIPSRARPRKTYPARYSIAPGDKKMDGSLMFLLIQYFCLWSRSITFDVIFCEKVVNFGTVLS